MSGRQGGSRRAGRDTSGKDHDIELDLLNGILESIRKAKEYNDESARLGEEILALEDEIKASSSHKSQSGSTPEQHRKLDELYRKKLRNAEAEKKVHEDEVIIDKLAMWDAMRSNDEPVPRERGQNTKPRGSKPSQHRPIVESDVSADGSGGVSPAETTTTVNPRVETLKRKQTSQAQRGSTPSGPGRPPASTVAKEAVKDTPRETTASGTESEQTLHKGVLAERSGELKVGTEVFYKYSKALSDDVGVGIQCNIKKVHSDRNPIIYDVQDPEPDQSGKRSVHRATARDLYPIPQASAVYSDSRAPTFPQGAIVYAKYPETDTFYKAKVVRGLKGGEYTLRFEGEEDDTEKGVERRFVLDTRMR